MHAYRSLRHKLVSLIGYPVKGVQSIGQSTLEDERGDGPGYRQDQSVF